VIPDFELVNVSSRKRPILAVALALIYPGLGHAYLRSWFRALLWFGLVVSTSLVLIPEGIEPSGSGLEALLQMGRQIPIETVLLLFSISFFSMLDAYWVAVRQNQRAAVSEGTHCPNCGKEVEVDIDFCHWCTEPMYEQSE
jgi:hypothetical protein